MYINNGTLTSSEINFILLRRRDKFSCDIRANPRIDYRQAQRKPKESMVVYVQSA